MSRSSQIRIAVTVRATSTNVFARRYGDPSQLDPEGSLDIVEQTPWLSLVHDPAIGRIVGFTARRDVRLELGDDALRLPENLNFDVPEFGLFDASVSKILETALTDEASIVRKRRPPRMLRYPIDEAGRNTAFEELGSGAFSADEHELVGRWLVDHGHLDSGMAHLRVAHALEPSDPWIAEALASEFRRIGDDETARSVLTPSRSPQSDPWQVQEWNLRPAD